MASRKAKRLPRGKKVLLLRTCAADMTAHGGFLWPKKGYVEAPDWSPEARCGFGLHGLLWGEGGCSLLSWSEDARWLVVEALASEVVQLDGKVKVPRANVAHCGDRKSATEFLAERAPGRTIVGAILAAGDRGTATAGDRGTATAGYGGTATAGDGGTATAGDGGTATAGDRGTATAGYGGTATAGYGGQLQLRWWDNKADRYRTVIGYVGEDGIEPNVAYICRDGKLAKKSEVSQ